MAIGIADLRSAIGIAALVGGGGYAVARYAPIGNDVHNGWPTGGPVETHDVQVAAGVGAAGLLLGAPMGLVGAAVADAPRSLLGSSMVLGAIAGATLGVGLVLGNAARD